MLYRLAICFALASLVVLPSKRAGADVSIQAVYDTVDSVEIRNSDVPCCNHHALVVVKGVLAGASTSTSRSFDFGNNIDMATRCERLAIIAMSKPGKFQFGIGADAINPSNGAGGHGDCKLIVVTS